MDQVSEVFYINFALARLEVFKIRYQREIDLCRNDIFDGKEVVCDVALAHKSTGMDVKELEDHFKLLTEFSVAQSTLASN